jgi:hypothetical protein
MKIRNHKYKGQKNVAKVALDPLDYAGRNFFCKSPKQIYTNNSIRKL